MCKIVGSGIFSLIIFSLIIFSLSVCYLTVLDSATLNCWGCGSQDDPLVRTGHKRWVLMSPESKIPGLFFTTSFNVMPGVLSDGSGCRLSQKFPVCYYGLNIDCDFISMENCSLETCAWTGRKTLVQLFKVTIVEDLFSIRSKIKIFNAILFLRMKLSFI